MKNKLFALLLTAITASSMVQARYYDDSGYEHRSFFENLVESPVEVPAAMVDKGHYADPAYNPDYDTRNGNNQPSGNRRQMRRQSRRSSNNKNQSNSRKRTRADDERRRDRD